MFIFKKIISCFLTPLSFSLFLSFLGLFLLWFTTKQKAGKDIGIGWYNCFGFVSYNIIADKLLRPLERQYDKFEMGRLSASAKMQRTNPI